MCVQADRRSIRLAGNESPIVVRKANLPKATVAQISSYEGKGYYLFIKMMRLTHSCDSGMAIAKLGKTPRGWEIDSRLPRFLQGSPSKPTQ